MTVAPSLSPTRSPTPLNYDTLPGSVKLRLAMHYDPNLDVAAMWVALFLAVTLIITYQIYRYGSKFAWIIVATGLMEVIGYGTRISVGHHYDLNVFIIESLCLLIAPILFAYVCYLTAGWLVMEVGKKVHVFWWEVSAENIARIFLASDLVCLLLQGAGGGMLAINNTVIINIGNSIVLTGLAVQLIFFTAYFWIIVKLRFQHEFKLKYVTSLYPLFNGLFITVGCMYIRNIYRVADYASISAHSWRSPGWFPSQEVIFFCMESAPIFFAFLTYAVLPFQWYLGYHETEKPETWKRELKEVEKKYSFESDATDVANAGGGAAAKEEA